MTALWVAFAFVAGWLASQYFSRKLLRALGGKYKLMNDVLRGMSHDALLRLSAATQDELARRKETLS